MAAEFSIASKHGEAVRAGSATGRLAFSRLPRGESLVYSATPAIKYIASGHGRYEVDGTEHVVLEGQFLLLEAGVRVRAMFPQQDTTGLCLFMPAGDATPYVSLATSQERPEGAGVKRAIVLSASGSRLGNCLRSTARILAADTGRGPALAEKVLASASSLLQPTIIDIHSRLAGLEAKKGHTRRDLLRRLEMVRAWLHDNDDRAVPLDELARVGGMSQFHLLRCFAAAFGVPPAAFHRRLRLERALEKVKRGQLDRAGAAERYGFSDERSFRRACRKQFGLPGAEPAFQL